MKPAAVKKLLDATVGGHEVQARLGRAFPEDWRPRLAYQARGALYLFRIDTNPPGPHGGMHSQFGLSANDLAFRGMDVFWRALDNAILDLKDFISQLGAKK